MSSDHLNSIIFVSKTAEELPLEFTEHRLDFKATTFQKLKELVKANYTGTTRLTDNDIGFFYKQRSILSFPPMKLTSEYNMAHDSVVEDLVENETNQEIEIEVVINVDGFFRNYEPIFTGGLLRSEGEGFISNLLNSNIGDLLGEGTRETVDIDFGTHPIPLGISDTIESAIKEESGELLKSDAITPRIQFVDTITGNRIKILSDIVEDAFVLVEIEDAENYTSRRGYLPKKNFECISNFVLSFTPKYSHYLETITVPGTKSKDSISFKNDVLFLDKQLLLENGVLTMREAQKMRHNSQSRNTNNIILNTQQNDDINFEDRNTNVMDDLRVIFNPRPAFIESLLLFLGVVFKTVYLIIKHSILASFVLFQLANFIPIYYALSLVILNLLFTLLSDVEIKRTWEEFFKSFKMFEKDYNDLLNMVLEWKHIPLHFLVHLEDNLLVRDYLSDSIRNTHDFKLLESLYGIIKDDHIAKDINIEELKLFIQNAQLPKRIMTYPYQTVDEESHLMLAEPFLEDTCLDKFVEQVLKILKEVFDKRCLKKSELFNEVNSKTLNNLLLREGKNMLKERYKIYLDFQKPLFDLIVEDLNFWKINNIHLKRNNVMRWNVDLDSNNDNTSLQVLNEAETTRIDADLFSMLEMILKSIRYPAKLLPFRTIHTIKDPFFKYNYVLDNYVVYLNNGRERVFYKNGEVQRVVFNDNEYGPQVSNSFSRTQDFIWNVLVQSLLMPIKSLVLILRWNFEAYKFIFSILFIEKERWCSTLKENLFDGDIVYNFIIVDSDHALGYGLLKHMMLFWCIMIPAYQEKLHTIMNERDHFYEQLKNFKKHEMEKAEKEEEEKERKAEEEEEEKERKAEEKEEEKEKERKAEEEEEEEEKERKAEEEEKERKVDEEERKAKKVEEETKANRLKQDHETEQSTEHFQSNGNIEAASSVAAEPSLA